MGASLLTYRVITLDISTFSTEDTRQIPLADRPINEAISFLTEAGTEDRGAVFTKHEVVEFILDLIGYTADRPLHEYRLLEPAFGDGQFLFAAVDRLVDAYQKNNSDHSDVVVDLSLAISAVEVHRISVEKVSEKIVVLLVSKGIRYDDAKSLVTKWLIQGDFLLTQGPENFTHVVGNPPYLRQEQIPDALLAEYRKRYSTMYDRADLYVPFIERCLTLLNSGGTLGLICADRWMKNKYGGPLRSLIAQQYRLMSYVDMVDTQAFDSEVSAYPAITVIRRDTGNLTRVAERPVINRIALAKLAKAITSDTKLAADDVIEVQDVLNGDQPWILHSPSQLKFVRRLERDFPLIEDAGCKIGIGVATGADSVYIGDDKSLDVEPDRKLPLVKPRDIASGSVDWQGLSVINPFNDDGTLVSLTEYPKLAKYLEIHESQIRGRNCAKRNPSRWYRTIDRIWPYLAKQEKLLIPDIKGRAHIVYESGQLYPHHNLYFITSKSWKLKALQAILMSGIAELFVSMYSTKMRGGYLRYQAQYLRRIRLPRWENIDESTRDLLVTSASEGDIAACNRATRKVYNISDKEYQTISSFGARGSS